MQGSADDVSDDEEVVVSDYILCMYDDVKRTKSKKWKKRKLTLVQGMARLNNENFCFKKLDADVVE